MAVKTETFEITATSEFKNQLEAEAARLHLSVSAYLYYLHARRQGVVDPKLFDEVVEAVFGRYGEVMRRLAK